MVIPRPKARLSQDNGRNPLDTHDVVWRTDGARSVARGSGAARGGTHGTRVVLVRHGARHVGWSATRRASPGERVTYMTRRVDHSTGRC